MSKQLDLGAFLSEQTSEGVVDSRGQFTVSHVQAARKLAKFALPRPSAWVTKLIQAANRWSCPAVQIRQTATETLFHFTLPSLGQIPTEDAIVSSLLSAKIGGQEALDAFSLALRALVEQARLSFILVADDGDLEPRPIYAGHYYGDISERARLDRRFRPKPGLSLTVYHRPPAKEDDGLFDAVSRLRSYVPIIEELDKYCHVSQVSILLDGRRVDSLVSAPSLGLTETTRPLMFLGVEGLQYSPPRLPLPLDFDEKLVSLLSHPRRIARGYGGGKDFQAVFVVSARTGPGLADLLGPRRMSRLVWVNDGAIVQDQVLGLTSRRVGLTIFANAQGLDTDLTGFTMLANAEFQSRRDEVLRGVAAVLKSPRVTSADFFRLDHDRQSHTDQEFDEQEEVRRRIKILLKGSGTGLTLSLFNPVIGVPTTLAAMVGTYVRKPQTVEARILSSRDSLQETIERELDELREFLVEKKEPDELSFDEGAE